MFLDFYILNLKTFVKCQYHFFILAAALMWSSNFTFGKLKKFYECRKPANGSFVKLCANFYQISPLPTLQIVFHDLIFTLAVFYRF